MGGVITLAVAALLILGMAAIQAGTASAATTSARPAVKVFAGDGNGFRVKPTTLSGWQVKDSTGTIQSPVVTGLKGTLDRPRSIQWKFWRKNKAVGRGLAWAQSCRVACPKAYPWDGSRVRVTAFRPRKGQFTRLRVFHWTNWGSPHANDENYNLKLKLTKQHSPRPLWKAVELDDGLTRPLK